MTRMPRDLRPVATAAATSLALLVLFVPPQRTAAISARSQVAPPSSHPVERFALRASGPVLDAPSLAGRFIASIGARAAALGYEHRAFELWAWPLKVADDLDVSFALEGYPPSFEGRDLLARVSVRPESTTLIYAHAAFTVRQILFVPPDESAIVMLFDVKSVLPLQLVVRFRPRLRLMWPGTSMTPFTSWDAATQTYDVGEESGKFAAVIAAPGARDLAMPPSGEEPRDVPLAFAFDPARYDAARHLPAVVVTASTEGRERARAAAARVLAGVPSLQAATVDHYRALLESTLEIDTPDDRVDRAFTWAKVGIDKGLATNSTLGTGLLAGFRTSGDSERPGFAWFFGRDALWTALATTAYGRFDTTRAALQFLARHQRADGKIPHEISQSAAFVPWFTGYPYAWASADATPLFLIAQADYWQATGDRAFLDASWPAIVKAYEFSRATDHDGNGLIENTNVGHGWVEGGALYPAHQEIYLQGLWIEAQRAIAALANVRGDGPLAAQAQGGAERTRAAVESTFWLQKSGHYAFATRTPTDKPSVAEPGPDRARRQAALDSLAPTGRIDEDTVLPAVPLWWRTLDPARAQIEIDRLGGGALATDWGARLLSRTSALYDPLSYHYGSVWPLFTGWVAMAAYRYGRPHVGYQALMANALLTEAGALGSITELISGELDTPFGRSADHQIWSQAMVATPLVRGLLGIEVSRGGSALTVGPQLPADWPAVHVRRVAAAGALFNLDIERTAERYSISLSRDGPSSSVALILAPALPLDANVRQVTVGGRSHPFTIEREGDIKRVRVAIGPQVLPIRLDITHDAGTDIVVPIVEPSRGAESEGLRVLRVMPERDALALRIEGRGQRTYTLTIYSPRAVSPVRATEGVAVLGRHGTAQSVSISFAGSPDDYVRRDLRLPLK
jgi:glycogen debranching enzyme